MRSDREVAVPAEPVVGSGAVASMPMGWMADRERLVAGLLTDTLRLHAEAVEQVMGEPDKVKLVETLTRLSQSLDRSMRALGKASPPLSRLAVALGVLSRQAEFIRQRFPQHLPVFAAILEPFGAELIREHEGGG